MSRPSTPLPAGPAAWYDVLPNTLAVVRDMPGEFRRLRDQHGDPFLIRTVNGRIVFSAEPEALRALFTAPPETFHIFGRQSLLPLLGPHSLLTNHGAPHARARKLLIPPLHGPMLARLADAMREAAAERTTAARTRGGFEALEWGREVALDVIFRAAFGVRDQSLHERLRLAIARLTDHVHPIFIFIPPLQQQWMPPFRRFLRLKAEVDAVLREVTDAASAQQDATRSVLSALLQARDEDGEALTWPELRDHLVTILVAGHETTAVALAWALHYLHAQPAIEERLRAELASAGEDPMAELPWLDAICHEALRLHPIVPEVLRQLAQPWEWCGYRLPAGHCVGAAISLAHSREEAYPEPAAFRPERFLERKFTPFEFIPFGGGHRRCIGAAFALLEMRLALRTLLQSGRWRLRDSAFPGVTRRGVILVPERRIELTTA